MVGKSHTGCVCAWFVSLSVAELRSKRQVSNPDLYASILAGSCYEVPISAICASSGNGFLTLRLPKLKHTSLLFGVFNFPYPHSRII
jgi:hypothetical protein